MAHDLEQDVKISDESSIEKPACEMKEILETIESSDIHTSITNNEPTPPPSHSNVTPGMQTIIRPQWVEQMLDKLVLRAVLTRGWTFGGMLLSSFLIKTSSNIDLLSTKSHISLEKYQYDKCTIIWLRTCRLINNLQ